MTAAGHKHGGITEAAAAGAGYGICAGLLLGGGDVLGGASALFRELDDVGTWLPLALRQALLPVGGAALFGLLLSLLLHGLAQGAKRQALGRAGRAAGWLGNYVALLTLPGLIWLSGQVFAGPRAQKLPGRWALMVLLVVLGLFTVRSVTAWLADRPPGRQPGLSLLSLLGLAACLWADRFVLPRLYPWFHLSLELAALLCGLAVPWALSQPAGDGLLFSGRRRQLAVLLAVPLLCSVSFWALTRLHRASVLRSYILEHATIGATLLRPYAVWRTAWVRGRESLPTVAGVPGVVPGGDDSPPPVPPLPAGPRLAGRDVFLITVDALRHDRLALMPTVRELAARGIVFDRAYTGVPHTSFALATLLTGKPVYALLTLGQDAASHETLPIVLRRFRYKTAAFYPPSVFYIEHARLKSLEDSAYGFEYVKYEYLNGERRTDQVLAFLETEKPERAFVWVHYLEPHEPYEIHPELPAGQATASGASDRERYDGEIAYVDREIGRLLAYLKVHRPGAIVLLAADHGEEFSEHGGRYHGTTLYEELVHIPLVLSTVQSQPADPRSDAAARALDAGGATPQAKAVSADENPLGRPRHVAAPVGLMDLAPTLLGLLDIERSARMRGRDLSPWLLTGAAALPIGPVFAEIGRKKMVVLGDDKLICDLATDACQLFNLASDPGEQHNLLSQRPQVFVRLRGFLDRSLAEARRFEEGGDGKTGTAASAPPPTVLDAQTLSRARLGDRAVLPQLVAALPLANDAAQRRLLLSLLSPLIATRLPPSDPSLIDPLSPLVSPALWHSLQQALSLAEESGDGVSARWAAMTLLRLSPAQTEPPQKVPGLAQVRALLLDESADPEQRLCGALALSVLPACRPRAESSPGQTVGEKPPRAPIGPTSPGPVKASPQRSEPEGSDCVALWTTSGVLPAALSLQDADRVRPLLDLIGHSRDPRALSPLLAQLDNVLSRADLVRALGTLGQVGAVPALSERLRRDPYVHVRAAAATALGALSRSSAAALAALLSAEKSEHEPAVLTAIAAAKSAATRR